LDPLRLIANDPPISHPHDALGEPGDLLLMSNDYNSAARIVQRTKNPEAFGTGCGIEVAGGLIGQ
jgi:hypothetical protein